MHTFYGKRNIPWKHIFTKKCLHTLKNIERKRIEKNMEKKRVHSCTVDTFKINQDIFFLTFPEEPNLSEYKLCVGALQFLINCHIYKFHAETKFKIWKFLIEWYISNFYESNEHYQREVSTTNLRSKNNTRSYNKLCQFYTGHYETNCERYACILFEMN